MNVTFQKNDYIDTVIVNTADEAPLYKVDTPFGVLHRTTSIRRVVPGVDSGSELIAAIQWAAIDLRSSEVTYRGVTVKMRDLLDRPNILSRTRIFTGHDGRQYKWEHKLTEFELFDVLTNERVAESHRRSFGIIGPSTKLNIDISPQAAHMVDDIIVTFIIVAEERWKLALRHVQ